MVFTGVIIEESLESKNILKILKIISTKVSVVNEKHRTPWVKQWTMHTVEIAAAKIEEIAEEMSKSIDSKHSNAWYADFKDDYKHYIIFLGKVFLINRKSQKEYDEAREYGVSIGIPEYQLNFKVIS